MNLFLCAGRIISDISFKFILQGKTFSTSKFKMQLFDGMVIDVIAYDNTADYAYRKLSKDDFVFCKATLGKNEIVIEYIDLLERKEVSI